MRSGASGNGVNEARTGTITVKNGSRVTVIAPPRLLPEGDGAMYVEMFDKQTLARYFRVSVDNDRSARQGRETPSRKDREPGSIHAR
jgi:hypothetical protein